MIFQSHFHLSSQFLFTLSVLCTIKHSKNSWITSQARVMPPQNMCSVTVRAGERRLWLRTLCCSKKFTVANRGDNYEPINKSIKFTETSITKKCLPVSHTCTCTVMHPPTGLCHFWRIYNSLWFFSLLHDGQDPSCFYTYSFSTGGPALFSWDSSHKHPPQKWFWIASLSRCRWGLSPNSSCMSIHRFMGKQLSKQFIDCSEDSSDGNTHF